MKVNEAVRTGLINQIKSTCASDVRMLSGFLPEEELESFVLDAVKHAYVVPLDRCVKAKEGSLKPECSLDVKPNDVI